MHEQAEQWPLGRLLSAAARAVERDWDERLRAIGLTHAALIAIDILIRSVADDLEGTRLRRRTSDRRRCP